MASCCLAPNTKTSESTAAAPASRAAPAQEAFGMRAYTPTELIDIGAKSQQKARESIQAWLAQLWDALDM